MFTTQLFQGVQVAPGVMEDLIEFGKSRHWYFVEVEGMKGVIDNPILKSNFHYIPIEMETEEIHPEALRRLETVKKAMFPIAQVIIAHEVEDKGNSNSSTIEIPKLPNLPKVPWKKVGKVALIGTAGVVALPMVAVVTVGLGMAAVTVGALAALVAVDPQLIVCIDDGTPDGGPWVCLFAWEV